MGYVDFAYYTQNFMGSKIKSENEFAALEHRASGYIDYITNGDLSNYADGVKMATCAVCDVLFSFDESGKISESNDGYSVRYITSHEEATVRMYEAAKLYLPDSLLYRGLV